MLKDNWLSRLIQSILVGVVLIYPITVLVGIVRSGELTSDSTPAILVACILIYIIVEILITLIYTLVIYLIYSGIKLGHWIRYGRDKNCLVTYTEILLWIPRIITTKVYVTLDYFNRRKL